MTQLTNVAAASALALILVGSPVASAQTAAPSTPATAQAPATQPAAAPVMKFPQDGLGLLETVQLTLQHSPNIRLQQTDTTLQRGIAQEQSGRFDATLRGGLTYDYRIQELTETRKTQERQLREDLAFGLVENRQNQATARATLALVQQIRGSSTSSEAQLRALAQMDPAAATQLQLIEQLIRTQPAQVQGSLQAVRQEFISSVLANAQAGLDAGIAEFANQQSRLDRIGVAPFDEVFYNGLLTAQFSKAFRNGLSFAPFFEGAQDGTNYRGKPRSAEFGGKGIFDVYTFRAGADAFVPLLRGRGRIAFGGPEQAARIRVNASEFSEQHESAATALDAIRAYWDLRAAQDNVATAQRSLGLQSKLRELTQALIKGNELPQIELSRVQASEARAAARLRDAERARHEARVTLATVMGLAVTDDPATLPIARDPFPTTPEPASLQDTLISGLMNQAVEQRNDVKAAARQQEAGEILVRSARTDLRALLDVQGGVWATALDEAIVSRALDRWVGPSASLAVDFERPLGNNQAEGRLQQREADYRRSQISNVDSQRQARLGVVRAARSLREAVARVQQAEAAVKFSQAITTAEQDRLRAGETNLIDTLLTEDQQVSAEQALTAARRDLANLIAELRYESGSLVPADPAALAGQQLITVPRSGGK